MLLAFLSLALPSFPASVQHDEDVQPHDVVQGQDGRELSQPMGHLGDVDAPNRGVPSRVHHTFLVRAMVIPCGVNIHNLLLVPFRGKGCIRDGMGQTRSQDNDHHRNILASNRGA